MKTHARWGLLALILALFLLPGAAFAQATRTWVSGVGDDANPCSRTAPCKTFAGAISKTATGGIIDVLDPGGYGAVTITKAITIEAEGDVAGILVSGTNGIIINAPATDVVTLRGLSFEGLGTSPNAIRLLAGKQLVLERVTIESFTGAGLDLQPSAPTTVHLREVTIQNAGNAINAQPNASSPATGSLVIVMDNTRLIANANGIAAVGPSVVTMRDGAILSSTSNGVLATGGANTVTVSLTGVTIADSIVNGVFAQNVGATVRLSGAEITGNAQGLLASGGAQIVSFGDNRLIGNVVNGAPTSTVARQ